MHARRALLYVPGDDAHKIEKASRLGADSLCLDMEDGVAANRKVVARSTIVEALDNLEFGQSERLARINAVGTGLEEEDLKAVLPARPDGIVIPKVESGGQVAWVSSQLEAAEKQHGWPAGTIRLIAIVETARGLLNLSQIAGAGPRLEALIFGAEDLAGDIGATRTRAGMEVLYARSAIIIHAAAHDLQAIDMVYVDFKDRVGLKIEALQGAQMGFAGKQVIHPNQVDTVQEAFTPDDPAIAAAVRVMEAFDQHQQAGFGAFALDGKMVDAPMVKAARQVLERARAAGKI